jgi:hypothetical protein
VDKNLRHLQGAHRAKDMAALSIGRRTKRYRIHLCGKCSAGLIEMLKDLRLIKTKTP